MIAKVDHGPRAAKIPQHKVDQWLSRACLSGKRDSWRHLPPAVRTVPFRGSLQSCGKARRVENSHNDRIGFLRDKLFDLAIACEGSPFAFSDLTVHPFDFASEAIVSTI